MRSGGMRVARVSYIRREGTNVIRMLGSRFVISSTRWLSNSSRIHSRITSLFNEIMSLTGRMQPRPMSIAI